MAQPSNQPAANDSAAEQELEEVLGLYLREGWQEQYGLHLDKLVEEAKEAPPPPRV